ncbi:MAG: histidine kinase [Planctomycetia bacterium]
MHFHVEPNDSMISQGISLAGSNRFVGTIRMMLFVAVGMITVSNCRLAWAQAMPTGHLPGIPASSLVIQYLVDQSRELTAADALNAPTGSWICNLPELETSFGYTTAAVWCHIRFSVHTDTAMVVELPTTRIDHVDWFRVTGNTAAYVTSNGYRDNADTTFAPQQYPSVRLRQSAPNEYQVLFRAVSDCALAIPIQIHPAAQLPAVELGRCARGHLEIGIAVAIAAVCMTLAMLFRDISLALLGFCGVWVICYGILFDTVLSLPGYSVPAWLPRTGCSFFGTLQAFSMLAFCAAHTGTGNLSRIDRLVLALGSCTSLAILLMHIWAPYSTLVSWLNGICILDSICSVWIISIRYRSDRNLPDLLPIVILMLAHFPALLLILYFHGYYLSYMSPRSLRMIAMPIVFCGLLFSLLQRRRSVENLRLHAALARVGESEARLMALRYQLNPHMLMNCLTAISSLSRRAPEQIPAVIHNLANILHAKLKPATGFHWTLDQELKLARSLVALEQVRFDGQLHFSESVSADAQSCSLPEMLLQPLVENALKYCTTDSRSPELKIEAFMGRDLLLIRVVNSLAIDTGVTVSEGFQIGHANIRERLDLTYGGRAQFQFSVREAFAVAEIRIPRTVDTNLHE